MKRVFLLLTFLLFAPPATRAAETQPITFYLQLVRGNNEDKAPVPEARPIGAKLSKKLRAVFKWQYFWELKRDSVCLKAGEKTRRRMSSEREVEVERVNAGQTVVRIYRNGRLTLIEKQTAGAQCTVVGGEKGGDESWFIVVRRDQPVPPEKP
jgi:hypothetical protein